MWEIKHQAMLETSESCCRDCNMKYWEACTGIAMHFERVDGCKKALYEYEKMFNQLINKDRY